MSQSRFIILVGRGNHFHGEGFHPDRLLAYFGDKGVWVLWDEGGVRHRFLTKGEFIIDDALLMISLFVLLPCTREESPILSEEDISKCLDVEEHEERHIQRAPRRLRRRRPSTTIKVKDGIEREEMLELYEKNKRFISTFYDLKLLCVLLSAVTFRCGLAHVYTGERRVDGDEESWRETVDELDGILKKEYGLKNYEICPSVRASFWGSFCNNKVCDNKDGSE